MPILCGSLNFGGETVVLFELHNRQYSMLVGVTSAAAVQRSMTNRAQRDQVVLGIVPASAAEFFVMNLKISKAAAGLTSPSISLQDFSTEPVVGFARNPQTGMFGPDRIHEARWETCDKKACF